MKQFASWEQIAKKFFNKVLAVIIGSIAIFNIKFVFDPFSTRKLKNLIFEMTIIPHALNINILRTTSLSTCIPLESLSNIL